jgi:guanylate kinase
VDDGNIDLDNNDYLIIGTLEAYTGIREHFGKERTEAIYIELDDGVRLERALFRERQQASPKYKEMCRRFLADCEDFSEEKLKAAGIQRRFINNDLEKCLSEIEGYISENG